MFEAEKRVDPDRIREMLEYFPETGHLIWKKNRLTQLVGQRAGSLRQTKSETQYRVVNQKGTFILEHRVAWFLYYGEWPSNVIDHINGDGSDNRICNLREVTIHQNMHNCKIRTTNTSGCTGIVFRPDRKKWRANITVLGKKHYLGLFTDKKDAEKAYFEASIKLIGPINRRAVECCLPS